MNAGAPLEGFGVSLSPLRAEDADVLVRITDDALWRFSPQAPGPLPVTVDEHRAWLAKWMAASLSAMEEGRELVFAVRRLSDGEVVGSTRYLNLAWAHRRVEIGGTFYGERSRRTFVNTACKRLLLGRAFDELRCQRVELKCDARNTASRTAIARLGATLEGTFRRHMILGDGYTRDTVYFSVLDAEWPAVRDRLTARLQAG